MVSNKNKIIAYLHCGLCLEEWKKSRINKKISPKDYARTQSGWTKEGLQIWCNRHNCNIIHIDFEGHKYPANTSIPKEAHKNTMVASQPATNSHPSINCNCKDCKEITN